MAECNVWNLAKFLLSFMNQARFSVADISGRHWVLWTPKDQTGPITPHITLDGSLQTDAEIEDISERPCYVESLQCQPHSLRSYTQHPGPKQTGSSSRHTLLQAQCLTPGSVLTYPEIVIKNSVYTQPVCLIQTANFWCREFLFLFIF